MRGLGTRLGLDWLSTKLVEYNSYTFPQSFVDVLKVVDLVQEWPVEVLHRNSSQ